MCDETTERELDAYLKRKSVTRRGFTVGASATLAATGLLIPACATPLPADTSLTETEVKIAMPEGELDALFGLRAQAIACLRPTPIIARTQAAFSKRVRPSATRVGVTWLGHIIKRSLLQPL